MPHPLEHSPVGRPLTDAEADALAASMRAFGTGSRIRILWALLDGERSVEQLEEATGLGQSLVSHQLRMLRELQFVAARRDGRHQFYRLFDHHVPDLLAAIRHHQEHLDAHAASTAAAAERTSV